MNIREVTITKTADEGVVGDGKARLAILLRLQRFGMRRVFYNVWDANRNYTYEISLRLDALKTEKLLL